MAYRASTCDTYTRSLGIQDRIDRSVAQLERIASGKLTSGSVPSAVAVASPVFHPDLSRQDVDLLTGALSKHIDEKRLFETAK